MFEGFSDRARAVVAAATDEARRLDHERVGTEHLLLGLLVDPDGGAAAVLHEAGATLAAARHKVAEVVVAGDGEAHGEDLPFTPRARRALERAGRFSRHDGSPKVGADHVLLGVLDVEGLGCQVLRGLGVDVAHLRDSVAGARDTPAPATADEPVEEERSAPLCATCGEALDATLSARVPHAQRATGTAKRVLVVYCSGCGAALGVVPP